MLICTGCGSTEALDVIQARGYRSCCPERRMKTAAQLNAEYEEGRRRYREEHPHVDPKRLAVD